MHHVALLAVAWLLVVGCRSPAPEPSQGSVLVGSASAPTTRALGSAAPPNAAPAPALRWVAELGQSFSPIDAREEAFQSATIHVVSADVDFDALFAQHPGAVLGADAAELCALVGPLKSRGANLALMVADVRLEEARCLLAIRPAARWFEAAPGPAAGDLLLVTALDGCEALGITRGRDPLVRLLVEQAAPALRSVALLSARLSGTTLAQLAQLTQLRSLNLRGLELTDADHTGFAALARLVQLERLDLSHGPVTDADLAALVAPQRLEWLTLEATKIGDQGMRAFTSLPRLAHVNLAFTQITNATVEALAGANLRTLHAANTDLDDACAPALARMLNLHGLDLRGTKITDKVLPSLEKLPLRYVYLPSAVSNAALARWQRRHPDAHVDRER